MNLLIKITKHTEETQHYAEKKPTTIKDNQQMEQMEIYPWRTRDHRAKSEKIFKINMF